MAPSISLLQPVLSLNPASHHNRDQIVAAFSCFKIKIAQLAKAMSGHLKRAASAAKKDKEKKARESSSESDDSDALRMLK